MVNEQLTENQQIVFDSLEESGQIDVFKDTIKRVPTEEESGLTLQSVLQGEEIELLLPFRRFDDFEVPITVEHVIDFGVEYEVLSDSYLLEVVWVDYHKILLR